MGGMLSGLRWSWSEGAKKPHDSAEPEAHILKAGVVAENLTVHRSLI